MCKIAIVSFAESRGGAAKSARNTYLACRKNGVDTDFIVVEKNTLDTSVLHPKKIDYFKHYLLRLIAYAIQFLQWGGSPVKRSLNIFSCKYIIDKLDEYQCVHLHWINNETISIEEIASLNGNIIITMHDEWFYCGSEHLSLDSQRPFEGYTTANKNVKGIDFDRITWERKKILLNAIKDRVIFTAPSKWLVERAQKSALLKKNDIRLIPNSIDVESFRYYSQSSFLQKYGISSKQKVILFGAVHGKNMRQKGFHVLSEALNLLSQRYENKENITIVTFGGEKKRCIKGLGFEHIEVGVINNKEQLAELYSSATITAVPSFVESFGQIAAESLSCQTPVIAFDNAGLKDIVVHKINGYLAKPFSAKSFCEGLEWMLNLKSEELISLGSNGRKHVEDNFSESVVIKKTIDLYREKFFDFCS